MKALYWILAGIVVFEVLVGIALIVVNQRIAYLKAHGEPPKVETR